MKLTSKTMKKIERFALKKMKNVEPGHGKHHIEEVMKLCKILIKKEGGNFKLCKAAAFLHDIEKDKCKDHAYGSSKTSRKFLKRLGIDEDIIENVCKIIYEHNKTIPNPSLESKIFHDADKLDGLGPRGFLRAFSYEIFRTKKFRHSIKFAIGIQKEFIRYLKLKTSKKIGRKRLKQLNIFMKNLK